MKKLFKLLQREGSRVVAAHILSELARKGLKEIPEGDYLRSFLIARTLSQKGWVEGRLAAVLEEVLVSPDTALELFNATMRSAESVFKTTLNTTLAAVQRRNAREQSGFSSYALYIGPKSDRIIRPYCAALVGKVVELEKLPPNGHGLPPRDFAGGWNCRHRLVPVPPDYSEAPRATSEDYEAAREGARSQ